MPGPNAAPNTRPNESAEIRFAGITRTQGLRGQVRVRIDFDDPRLFEPGREVQLTLGTQSRRVRIEDCRQQHGRWVLKMEGIDSIDDAEAWIGAVLSVPRDELPEAEEGSYFSFDLEGCAVFADGRLVGTVERVLDYSATTLLEVRRADRSDRGDRDGLGGAGAGTDDEDPGTAGNPILIPFVKAYLDGVDLDERRIDFSLPEGMLELNR
jgi:16S rRNA processing protein RimM